MQMDCRKLASVLLIFLALSVYSQAEASPRDRLDKNNAWCDEIDEDDCDDGDDEYDDDGHDDEDVHEHNR